MRTIIASKMLTVMGETFSFFFIFVLHLIREIYPHKSKFPAPSSIFHLSYIRGPIKLYFLETLQRIFSASNRWYVPTRTYRSQFIVLSYMYMRIPLCHWSIAVTRAPRENRSEIERKNRWNKQINSDYNKIITSRNKKKSAALCDQFWKRWYLHGAEKQT